MHGWLPAGPPPTRALRTPGACKQPAARSARVARTEGAGVRDKSLEILPVFAASIGTGAGYSAQATDTSRPHVAVDALFPRKRDESLLFCN
jgi:hypothetical protein